MARPLRESPGGVVYHVLNRGNARARIFKTESDYAAFEKIMAQARERLPMRILAYCLMPNHWHLVLWPHDDGDLSEFMRWLTVTHTQRIHARRHTSGSGHVYQGRFKSFPIQQDEHYLTVCRYVERNPLRANLVQRAQDWQHGSLAHRGVHSNTLLSDGPVPLPRDWLTRANRPQTPKDEQAVRHSIARGSPFGGDGWIIRMADNLQLRSTLRPRGRPKKEKQPKQ